MDLEIKVRQFVEAHFSLEDPYAWVAGIDVQWHFRQWSGLDVSAIRLYDHMTRAGAIRASARAARSIRTGTLRTHMGFWKLTPLPGVEVLWRPLTDHSLGININKTDVMKEKREA